MTVGIIGAMDEEIALFQEIINDQKELKVANSLFIEGKIENQRVVLLKSGIGKVNAAVATTIMHERFNPKLVINTGSAGGFSKNLKIGDLVISNEVVHHDVDVTAFRYKYGQVPGLPPTFKADERLIELTIQAANQLKIDYEVGLIATSDSFMQDPKRVSEVRNRFPNMIAAEMEAAAIAQVCYRYSIPFVIIRALSDIAGKDASISFDEFINLAATNATKLITETIKCL